MSLKFGISKIQVCLTLIGISLFFSCAAQKIGKPHPKTIAAISDLQKRIDGFLADSVLMQTRVGIKVVSLQTGEVLYARNNQELFHPASNMKLLTTATALKTLGPAFTFRTILSADTGALNDSLLDGNLYLKGYGDPQLKTEDLQAMVAELKIRGIRKIKGNLICDDSYFDDLYWGSGWMWDDTSSPDFAPISALTLNENCVTVIVAPGRRVGDSLIIHLQPPTHYVKIENRGITVTPDDSLSLEKFKVERKWKFPENTIVVEGGLAIDSPAEKFVIEVLKPALYAGTIFKELLTSAGISLQGDVRVGNVPDTTALLFEHRSEPLSQIVFHTNKISDNLSAELLLKTVGAEVKGPPGSAKKGISVINQYLASIGVDTTRYELADGSGVSRYNVVTPNVIIEVLKDMYKDFHVQAEYQASLPIAGVDGTLEKRMKNSVAENLLRAKTGTLRGVSALSGYTKSRDGEILAFSIMMEHFVGSSSKVRAIQDSIGVALSAFSRQAVQ